jgi:hypothetical protein
VRNASPNKTGAHSPAVFTKRPRHNYRGLNRMNAPPTLLILGSTDGVTAPDSDRMQRFRTGELDDGHCCGLEKRSGIRRGGSRGWSGGEVTVIWKSVRMCCTLSRRRSSGRTWRSSSDDERHQPHDLVRDPCHRWSRRGKRRCEDFVRLADRLWARTTGRREDRQNDRRDSLPGRGSF